jgi:hypothetical protein
LSRIQKERPGVATGPFSFLSESRRAGISGK